MPKGMNNIKALESFKKSCSIPHLHYLNNVCQKALKHTNNKIALEFFKNNFNPYKLISNNGKKNALITGYYEPTLFGSRFKNKEFKYPVYAIPKDFRHRSYYPYRGRYLKNKYVPYFTRKEIEKRGINSKVICYVNNKVDLFFMHIQGSGYIKLNSNQNIYVGYHNQNGHPYRSIGRYMLNKGYLQKDDISLQTIKQWLRNNPKQIDEVLYHNPRYIFFKESKLAATGSTGVVLTPYHSIAVDGRYIPFGIPTFISTTNPITKKALNYITIAQDKGGAIKGELRIDYFFGSGSLAGKLAGKMKESGTIWLLLPKDYKTKES